MRNPSLPRFGRFGVKISLAELPTKFEAYRGFISSTGAKRRRAQRCLAIRIKNFVEKSAVSDYCALAQYSEGKRCKEDASIHVRVGSYRTKRKPEEVYRVYRRTILSDWMFFSAFRVSTISAASRTRDL